MSFSEFSALLGVFLNGAPSAEVSLTLTQAPDRAALRAFIDEAVRAGAESGMILRQVQVPLGHAVQSDIGVDVTDSGDPAVVRFVYAPCEAAA
jgi:hypothetical protein